MRRLFLVATAVVGLALGGCSGPSGTSGQSAAVPSSSGSRVAQPADECVTSVAAALKAVLATNVGAGDPAADKATVVAFTARYTNMPEMSIFKQLNDDDGAVIVRQVANGTDRNTALMDLMSGLGPDLTRSCAEAFG